MSGFFISVAAVFFAILIAVTPFQVKSHTAVSIKKLFIVENINLFGFVSVALSLHLKDGKILFNGDILTKKTQKNTAKNKNPVDIFGLIKDFNFVSFDVIGSFGNAGDAASTALISSSIIMIINLIKNTMFGNLPHFNINFLPLYDKNILDFDVKFKVKLNIFLIILTFVRILRKR